MPWATAIDPGPYESYQSVSFEVETDDHNAPTAFLVDPAIDGETLTRDWLRTIYHSPDDESDQKLDYDAGARWARTNLDLALTIANAKERPRWNEGDFFGMRFAPAGQ